MNGKSKKKDGAQLKLSLTEDQKSWIRVRAATLNTTMSEEIGRAIDLYRAHSEDKASAPAKGQTPT